MIEVEIITPEKVLLTESDNLRVDIPLTSGEYEVRENHAPYMANLASGVATLEKEGDEEDIILTIHGGFVQIAENTMKMVVKAAELKNDIDFDRAKESKDRADQRIKNPGDYKEPIDVQRAQLSLARALTRLKIKEI